MKKGQWENNVVYKGGTEISKSHNMLLFLSLLFSFVFFTQEIFSDISVTRQIAFLHNIDLVENVVLMVFLFFRVIRFLLIKAIFHYKKRHFFVKTNSALLYEHV
jgi:hypothetical protein